MDPCRRHASRCWHPLDSRADIAVNAFPTGITYPQIPWIPPSLTARGDASIPVYVPSPECSPNSWETMGRFGRVFHGVKKELSAP